MEKENSSRRVCAWLSRRRRTSGRWEGRPRRRPSQTRHLWSPHRERHPHHPRHRPSISSITADCTTNALMGKQISSFSLSVFGKEKLIAQRNGRFILISSTSCPWSGFFLFHYPFLWERSPFPRWDQLFSQLLRKSFSRGNSEEFTHKNLFYLFSRVNTIGATLTGWKFFNQMIGRIIVQRKTSHGREKNVTLSHFTAIWRRWAAQKSPKFGQLTSNRKKDSCCDSLSWHYQENSFAPSSTRKKKKRGHR